MYYTHWFFSWSKPWQCSNNNNSQHLTWMWSRGSICSIFSRHYMCLTKYSHFLGALLDTGLRNALIQNDRSLLFWQSPVALTRHRTYNFLTLHCQKFYSPFPKQSSLSLRVCLCCCWSYIYWHPVATFEDYGWLVHSHLKKKQLNDHYFILIHVNDKLLTKAWHMASEENRDEYMGWGLTIWEQREQKFSKFKIFFKNLLQIDSVTTKVYLVCMTFI